MQFDLHRLAVDLQSDLIGLQATRLLATLPGTAVYSALPRLTPRRRTCSSNFASKKNRDLCNRVVMPLGQYNSLCTDNSARVLNELFYI